ncbi:MAG: hypothetical protein AAFY42_11560 [Pseudomonadota bacterium]
MKLSDMMETVTAYSKDFEAQIGAWQNNAEAWAADAETQAKAWYSDAQARLQKTEETFGTFVASASETAKAEWDKADAVFNDQLAGLQAKTQDLRDSVSAYEAQARAEAAEAYAAALSKYAVSVQNEAEKAIAFAAEHRGKTEV